MRLHIQSKSTWLVPKTSASILLTATLILVSSQGIESIVKQQQQQQQQSQQQSQVSQSQQQRSDDVSQSQISNNQNAFNNHQQVSSATSGQAQNGVQSSVATAAGASGQQVNQMQSSGVSQSGVRPSISSSGSMDSLNSYGPSTANGNQKQSASYMDSMAAASSNPEQSYQAAAQSVNMALANSGIFGPNSYAPQQQSQSQSQGSSAGNNQQQGVASAQSALNPLHYFYYPAKENSQNVAPNSGSQNKQQDMISSSASNQYQSMAAYPSYSDQYNSFNSAAGLAVPDMAASNQDASYLPQPMDQSANQMFGQAPGQQAPNQQQPQMNNNNMNSPAQQQQQQQGQYNGGDMNAFGSNQMQSSPSSSISFSGPTSSQVGQSNGPQANSMMPQMGQGNGADYMNSHMGGHQQQTGPQSAQNNFQNSLFNQLASGGDLSTSNFGNNAGGLSSIASYMPPNSQPSNSQQQPNQQHDLFSSGLLGNQFNSAASQLSPSSIAPPSQQQHQQSQGSSLFSGSSSLFGGVSNSQQQQQQQQQQQNSLLAGATGGLNGAHNYLSSFLTPQQYQQLTGQQLSAMASEQSPLTMNAANSLQQQQQASLSSPASAASQIASSSSTGKRFGLSSFIMPMLALAGLSLLIPTMSNIGTAVGRKKRSIVEERVSTSNRQQQVKFDSLNGAHQLFKENSIGEYMDKIERYYSIYKNAVENDDCLNRLICEFGDAVKDVTGKSAVMAVLERVVPEWMTGKMHLFKEAALNTSSSGKEKCKKYVCQNGGRQQK